MRYLLAALALLAAPTARAADDAAAALCRSNPAYGVAVMRSVLEAQLQKDHDPALDATPPDQMAAEASEQGISDCATDLRANPAIFQALDGLTGTDLQVGWDAYNTACADHAATKSACIKAEVGSVRALKRMVATNTPPGAKTLVETCALVMQADPPMAEWRQCVDTALATHAAEAATLRCKTSVSWHVATSGAAAGDLIAGCLRQQK